MKLLKPHKRYSSISEIPVDDLVSSGITGVMLDLDNTSVPYQSEDIPQETTRWIEAAKEKGIRVCITSNSRPKRVQRVSDRLGLPGFASFLKPFPWAFKGPLDYLSKPKGEIAIVGDQIFTDILGGNLMGIKTILVEPLTKNDFWATPINRFLERLFRLR